MFLMCNGANDMACADLTVITCKPNAVIIITYASVR